MGLGLAIGAPIIGGIAESIFGKNPDTMTPEERRLYNYIWSELQKPTSELGFSRAEKAGMRGNLKTSLMDYANQQTGQSIASLSRRGLLSPGQASGMATEIKSNAGKAYGQGVTDIDLASMQAGRQWKGQLLGAVPTGHMQPEPDIGGGISDYLSNLAYYYAMKKKTPDYGQASYSNMQGPNWYYPRRG